MDDIELEIDTPAQDSFNAPADEDQDMEEGEIATPDDQDLRLNLNRRKPLHERLGPRVPKGATFGIENDFSSAGRFKLPDLVQELGGASGLTNDPEFSSKLTARAKRFQLENHLAEPTFEDFQAMKKSLIPDDLKEVRAEAIHVTGFGSKVQSNDLGDYFKDFSPISCEWIDGKSANVIWGVDASAAKALCYMSRPVTRSEADSEMESETNTEELLKKFQETKFNEPIDLNEFKLPDPPAGGPWRLGKPSGHDNFDGTTAIYMRLAFKDDIHKPLKERDLNMKNFQLRREGILSRSKKERIQQTLEEHQRIAIEHEESKKYKHLGSDPWGAIAEDWAGTKKAPKNFDDELAFVKDMMTRKRPIGNRSIDWDAPNADDQAEEEDDDDLVRVPRRGVKRQRLIARDGSESPPSTTLKLSEVQGEDPWTTKSKKPRMQMYADTVGEKSSAKQRIFGSIKRQVPNRPRTEIFEEETSEPEIDDSYVDAREKLKSIRVKAASFDTPSNAGRSNIFGSGGKKSNIRDRLGPGKSYDGYQSGDSLERDTGADLDPYNNSDKIQIRVTHSDNEDEHPTRRENRKDRNNDEAMEEDVDAHRDLDLRDRRQQRKSSPPKEQIKDLRSKISSEVVKIKTEKGEEDRRMRENRERKRRENEEREAEAAREARRRQRSERRVDNRDDQDDRRRRRENERRRNDSRGGHTRSDRDFRVSHPPALSEFRREEARLDRGNRDRDNDRDRGIDRNNRNREDRNVRDRGSERRSDRERDTRRRDERRDSKKPLRIKKEKVSDDESSSSDSSSSDSDSDSSSSSSSSSSSDSGSSDSDSDSSSSSNASQRKRRTQKSSKDSSKKTDSKEGIKDKLQEYLARAKEKRRRGGGK